MKIEQPRNNQKVEISVVIPVYGCDESLVELYDRLTVTLKSIVVNYEIIFIDDCGPGNPWKVIQDISEEDSNVKGIKLSRNFGQHVAITAGLMESTGEWVVVMDCDLQDKPEEIVNFFNVSQKGVEIVFAQRVVRQDSYLKKATSRLFYKVLGYLTETTLDSSVGNFGMYHRKVIDAVLSMSEAHKYFPVMVRWVGFSSISIPVLHENRKYGDTAYTYRKLITLSLGIILSFSNKPLRMIVKSGFIISFLSALYAFSIVINVFVNGAIVAGWSSMMASMWLIAGIMMSIIGIVGLYVGKTFDETKSRPKYIVRDRV